MRGSGLAVAVVEAMPSETMSTPGANRSTHAPQLDHDGEMSLLSVAATMKMAF